MRILKKLLVIVPLLLAVSFFAWAKKQAPAKPKADAEERARIVKIVVAKEQVFSPAAFGLGEAVPERSWKAVAEVKGRIVWRHPDLKEGKYVKEGELLVRIDPADYELAAAQERDNIRNIDAQLRESRKKLENFKALESIEQDKLKLQDKQLMRQRGLREKGVVSVADLDTEEKSFLAQRSAVITLSNSINLIPAQIDALESQRQMSEHKLSQAERDLARTEIKAPFDAKVDSRKVDLNEVVAVGDEICSLDSARSFEVEAQVPVDKMMPLVESIDSQDIAARLTAVVRCKVGKRTLTWPAKVERFASGVDTETRTIGVVVGVTNPVPEPGAKAAGFIQPLLKGMYCEVELRVAAGSPHIVVPRNCCDNGELWALDKDSRLRRRKVTVAFTDNDVAAISSGLRPGERVLLSELPYATEGMLVKPAEAEPAEGGGK